VEFGNRLPERREGRAQGDRGALPFDDDGSFVEDMIQAVTQGVFYWMDIVAWSIQRVHREEEEEGLCAWCCYKFGYYSIVTVGVVCR